MDLTREDWETLAPLSGNEVGRRLGIDGGTARRMIREARNDPAFSDLPWYRHEHQRPPIRLDTDTMLDDLDLLQPPEVGPAILLYDIETAPGLAWVWGAYDQNAIAFEQDWYMLSFAYKWLNTDQMGFVSIFQNPAFEADSPNDRRVARRLAALMDRADAVVAHNGDKFDRKKANQRFLYWDIDPPSPYKSIDTLKIVNSEFSHFTNRLNDLGRLHELGEKEHHTGFELWRECMRGNPEFWEVMERYNRRDTDLLESLYVKILPWMSLPGKKSHLNYGFWSEGKMVCPNCGHDHLVQKGVHRTLVSEFPTYQCERCRTFSRARKRKAQYDGGVQVV